MNVAVLFAREDSHYKQLPGVDVYDMARDARTYDGPHPVVAHPPCRAWASLRNHARPRPDERNLARLAVALVREFGGVLEHPHRTTLWEAQRLPAVGQRDAFGGFTLVIDQNWWGHRAQKRTRLYVVGCEPTEVPPMPLVLGEATHTVGLWSGRDKATCRPSIAKHEYEHTPPELARWLVNLAAKCRTRQAMQAASVARLGEILDGRQCPTISAADIGAQSYADDYGPANHKVTGASLLASALTDPLGPQLHRREERDARADLTGILFPRDAGKGSHDARARGHCRNRPLPEVHGEVNPEQRRRRPAL